MATRATFATALALLAFLCGLPSSAHSQAPPRSTPPATVATQALNLHGRNEATPRPDRTTATHGDWVLRCEFANASERGCELTHSIQDARGQLLALLTARRGTPEGQLTFTAQVGANTSVAEPARFVIEDQAALSLAFRRCMPRGCFATVQLAENEAFALGRRNDAAKLEYRDADGTPISIPVSLRGLTSSLEALKRAE
jgi:invasion protein IalB